MDVIVSLGGGVRWGGGGGVPIITDKNGHLN